MAINLTGIRSDAEDLFAGGDRFVERSFARKGKA